jgi:hypothetical protein
MNLPSLLTLSDVKDAPVVRKELPGPLRLGDMLLLRFVVRRRHGKRTEELRVDGEYRVTSVAFDARFGTHQVVSVEATKVTPSWRSVKNVPERRVLPPARAPRTVVE